MSGVCRNLVLALADAGCVFASWAFSLWAYWALGFGKYGEGFLFYLKFWPVMCAFVAVNGMFRLYHGRFFYPAAPIGPVEEFRRLVGSSLITHLGTIALLALSYQTTKNHSRVVIVMSGLLVAICSQPCRDLARRLLKHLRICQIPVKFIGSGDVANELKVEIFRNPHFGFCEADGESRIAAVVGDWNKVDFSAMMDKCSHIEFFPNGSTLPTLGAQAVSSGGWGGIELVNQRRMQVLRVEKWLVDKALSLLVVILASPLFVLVPVLIKLTSRGPVFYRHLRLGRGGRPIRVWKFRSMYADADERLSRVLAEDPVRRAEWAAKMKLGDDPRVTPFGRLLRKTSLDELPQLFNVFSGEMALVGPRPIVADEVPFYGEAYSTFSSVRPGITGLWQVSGRTETDYASRVALDVRYVLNWSPWLDIWILIRTVGAVALMRGAC